MIGLSSKREVFTVVYCYLFLFIVMVTGLIAAIIIFTTAPEYHSKQIVRT